MGELKQGIGNARIASPKAALHHKHLAGLIHLKYRHAIEGTGGICFGIGVHHIVGTEHDHHIGPGKLRIDDVHFEQLLIGHIGLSQQHIHVAWHPSRHRMDGIAHLHAMGFEQFGQFP